MTCIYTNLKCFVNGMVDLSDHHLYWHARTPKGTMVWTGVSDRNVLDHGSCLNVMVPWASSTWTSLADSNSEASRAILNPQGMCGSAIKRVLPPVCTSKLLILIAFIVGNLKDFKSEAASVSSSWAGAAWATWWGSSGDTGVLLWCLSQQSLRWFSFFGRTPKHGNYCHYCLFLFKLWHCHTQRRKSKSGLVNQL